MSTGDEFKNLKNMYVYLQEQTHQYLRIFLFYLCPEIEKIFFVTIILEIITEVRRRNKTKP